MFLDDKLKEIWDESGCAYTGCTSETLQALINECYSRIDKNNARNSIKQIDASYQRFAQSRGLNLHTFRQYYIANGKAVMKEKGWPDIEKKLIAICHDLGWDYDKLKLH